jgi:hypothetical protein
MKRFTDNTVYTHQSMAGLLRFQYHAALSLLLVGLIHDHNSEVHLVILGTP